MEKNRMKICFTTSLFGDPKLLDRPASFKKSSEFDYFLFTDIDKINTDWNVVNIKNNPKIKHLSSSVKKSRYPKFLSWEILKSMGLNYDVIFYCDACFYPNSNMDWYSLSKTIIDNDTFSFIQTVHHDPEVINGGILAEMELIVDNKRDSLESIKKSIKLLSNIDSSVSLSFPQYYENGCFGFSPKNKNIRDITEEFWRVYCEVDMTFRDQPLWNFLLIKNNFTPLVKNDFKYNTNNQDNNNSWFTYCPQNLGTMRSHYV